MTPLLWLEIEDGGVVRPPPSNLTEPSRRSEVCRHRNGIVPNFKTCIKDMKKSVSGRGFEPLYAAYRAHVSLSALLLTLN